MSPYLVKWSDLSEDIKQYDRDAVRAFPTLAAEAGLEVHRKAESRVAGG
jgi:hypothetical protein